MKSTKFRDSEKPDLEFSLGYPLETDKLQLRSGTVLQREVTGREKEEDWKESKSERKN